MEARRICGAVVFLILVFAFPVVGENLNANKGAVDSVGLVRSPVRNIQFEKNLLTRFTESSVSEIVEVLRSEGVIVVIVSARAEAGSLKNTQVSDDELKQITQLFTGEAAHIKKESGQLLALSIGPYEDAGKRPFIGRGMIVLLPDAPKWLVLHEYIHYLFCKYDKDSHLVVDGKQVDTNQWLAETSLEQERAMYTANKKLHPKISEDDFMKVGKELVQALFEARYYGFQARSNLYRAEIEANITYLDLRDVFKLTDEDMKRHVDALVGYTSKLHKLLAQEDWRKLTSQPQWLKSLVESDEYQNEKTKKVNEKFEIVYRETIEMAFVAGRYTFRPDIAKYWIDVETMELMREMGLEPRSRAR